MSELIEKQVIIDWLKYKWNGSADSLFYGIQGLPSAQPNFDITAKIDKAYGRGYEAGYLQGKHDWGDLDGKLIQKQDAINAHCMCSCGKERDEYCQCDDIALWFDVIPSVEPEQAVKDCRNCKHGEYNDYWETHFCYNPNACTEWNLWEPSVQQRLK